MLAEGIETEKQFIYLQERYIENYQGFLFDKPIPIEQFIIKYLS